jgi:hypothetical protein
VDDRDKIAYRLAIVIYLQAIIYLQATTAQNVGARAIKNKPSLLKFNRFKTHSTANGQ